MNLVLLLLIPYYEFNSTSDKTIIISSLAIAVIVILNLLCGLFSQLDNKPVYRHYYLSALGLLMGVLVLLSAW